MSNSKQHTPLQRQLGRLGLDNNPRLAILIEPSMDG